MPYDFMTLSPEDFEYLTRDLLSQEWGVQLEAFKAGRDRGIDLRHSRAKDASGTAIVQCKRYAPDSFSSLLRAMESEVPKIRKLAPSRYVLVTSVKLSPPNKDKLVAILTPWCRGPEDIYGPTEINGMLVRFPEIEKAHFKLWIASTGVLERLLNSRIFNITEDTVASLQSQLCRLVVHQGYERALRILHENHHVLIVGNPGIGKTTLARMLMCHYINDGFQPIVVMSNIDDAWQSVTSALKGAGRAVILYDDFLGQLRFDEAKFGKNEERSLWNLLSRTRASPNLRFLLTTREYILADARRLHGAFDERAAELVGCTLSLDDYSQAHRARILFNHLYFSDLPESRLQALVRQRVYRTIVSHRHFSPRIVEGISNLANSRSMTDGEYLKYVNEEFENPKKLWHHPFSHQISPTSRQLLEVLWTSGGLTDRTSLEECLIRLNAPEPADEVATRVRDSLKELDGNFISVERKRLAYTDSDWVWVVKFQNPSVEEYVEDVVVKDSRLIERLVGATTRFAQVAHLLSCTEREQKKKALLRETSSKFWSLMWEAAIRTQSTFDEHHVITGLLREHAFNTRAEGSVPRRTLVMLKIAKQAGARDGDYEQIRNRVITVSGWQSALAKVPNDDSEAYGVQQLLNWLMGVNLLQKRERLACAESFRDALRLLLANGDAFPISVDSLDSLLDCLLATGLKPVPEDMAQFERVAKIAAKTALDNYDDADSLDSEAESFSKLLARMGKEDEALRHELMRQANELRESSSSDEEGDYDEYRERASSYSDDNFDELFATLLDR